MIQTRGGRGGGEGEDEGTSEEGTRYLFFSLFFFNFCVVLGKGGDKERLGTGLGERGRGKQ